MSREFLRLVLITNLIGSFLINTSFGESGSNYLRELPKMNVEDLDLDIDIDLKDALGPYGGVSAKQEELQGLIVIHKQIEKIDKESADKLQKMIAAKIKELEQMPPEEQAKFLRSAYFDAQMASDAAIKDYQSGKIDKGELVEIITSNVGQTTASFFAVLLVIGPAFVPAQSIAAFYVRMSKVLLSVGVRILPYAVIAAEVAVLLEEAGELGKLQAQKTFQQINQKSREQMGRRLRELSVCRKKLASGTIKECLGYYRNVRDIDDDIDYYKRALTRSYQKELEVFRKSPAFTAKVEREYKGNAPGTYLEALKDWRSYVNPLIQLRQKIGF